MYAFDDSGFAVVVVPADELALVGVGLLFDGVVYDQDARGFILDLAHQRLDQAPQLGGVQLLSGEEAGDFVVADYPVGHLREAGGGGVAEGAQEVVGVEFEEVCVHNALKLTPSPRVSLLLSRFLRKVSSSIVP